MSQKTKFDRRLGDFIERAINSIAGLELQDPAAEPHKTLALSDLEQAKAILTPAVDQAIVENHDVYMASEATRRAESLVEGVYEPFQLSLEQVRIIKTLKDANVGAEFASEMAQVGASTAPSAFRALGIDQTLSVGQASVAFAVPHLDPENPHLNSLRDALTTLQKARAKLDTEKGQATNAMRTLEQARDRARTFYAAARDALRGGLRIDGRPEPLRQFMSPLSSIYSTTTPNDNNTDAPPAPDQPSPLPTDPTSGT